MRLDCLLLLGIAAVLVARAEIHDVVKSADIDSMLSRLNARHNDQALHERSNYALWLKVHEGKPSARETHSNADDVIFVRRGSARLTLGDRTHDIGAGDVALIPRGTPHVIDPGAGRLEYAVVRIFPETGATTGIRPAARRMSDVLKKADIDATFVKFDTNQPIHAAPNFTMNFVIYPSRVGPWEAHRNCADIYFIQTGTATAQLGGEIQNVKEDSPGEPRGDGVTGAREHQLAPGDIVLIPRNTAHHMNPGQGKLGYILMKVWAE